MRRMLPIALITLALLAGCGPQRPIMTQAATPPDWLEDAEAAYPAAHYHRGRASGSTQAEAEQAAAAELHAALRASHFEPASADALAAVADAQRLLHWRDPEDGRYHALAVLSHEDAARALLQQLVELDARIEAVRAEAQQQAEALGRARAVSAALRLQREREGVAALVRALDPQAQPPASRWSTARLERERDSLMRALALRPEGSGAHAELLQGQLTEALRARRLRADANADYTLSSNLAYDSAVGEGERFYYQGRLELMLLDAQRMPVGVRAWPLRAEGEDAAEALAQLYSRSGEVLEQELAAALAEFVE